MLNRTGLVFGLVLLVGCGGSNGSPSTVPQSAGPVGLPVQTVQLNDLHQQVFPSESVILGDSRLFTPPTSVLVVSGSPCASPFTPNKLKAEIRVNGSPVAEYESSNILSSIIPQTYQNVAYPISLVAGDIVELRNLIGCGLLYETIVTFTK